MHLIETGAGHRCTI